VDAVKPSKSTWSAVYGAWRRKNSSARKDLSRRRENCYEIDLPQRMDYQSFAERKTHEAERAVIPPLDTVADRSSYFPLRPIGNAWTRHHFDGDWSLFDPPSERPALSLVFVQSRDGNTIVADPAKLGGGPADFHLIYEGLSRVAADAVLAGAATVGKKVFFSVWHPEIVALRRELGLPRHPAQVVVSRQGRVNIESSLLFNVPDVPVFLVIEADGLGRIERVVAERSWITVVPIERNDLAGAFRRLRIDHGLERISVVGGRTIATALIDAGLAQDLCLTTSAIDGGTPNTPFYAGAVSPPLELIVRKRSTSESAPITFDHFAVISKTPTEN
jgi:riboflavin biosynthesis pyrimidine reductase